VFTPEPASLHVRRRAAGRVIRPRRERYAAFYQGFAWLKMPVDDTQRLVTLTKDITKGSGWAPNIHITPTGPTKWSSLHFPAYRIGEITHLLTS
jgi:hypothetical protein